MVQEYWSYSLSIGWCTLWGQHNSQWSCPYLTNPCVKLPFTWNLSFKDHLNIFHYYHQCHIGSPLMFCTSARNSSWLLAIFWPISTFGRPKSIWSAKFTVHFQWDSNQKPTKCLIFKKQPTISWPLFLPLLHWHMYVHISINNNTKLYGITCILNMYVCALAKMQYYYIHTHLEDLRMLHGNYSLEKYWRCSVQWMTVESRATQGGKGTTKQ